MHAAQNLTFEKIQRQRPALNEAELLRRQRSDKLAKPVRKDKRQHNEELQALQPVSLRRLRYQ